MITDNFYKITGNCKLQYQQFLLKVPKPKFLCENLCYNERTVEYRKNNWIPGKNLTLLKQETNMIRI